MLYRIYASQLLWYITHIYQKLHLKLNTNVRAFLMSSI